MTNQLRRSLSAFALAASTVAGGVVTPLVQASSPVVTLQASATSDLVGSPVTLTASNPGVSQAQYQFWVQNPQGQWSSTPYLWNNHWSFTPTQSGTYHVVVYVLSQPNVWAHRWAAALHPASPLTLTVQAPTVTLQASATSGTTGQGITLTLSNPGVSQAEYQFWVKNPNGQWVDATPYISSNQWTFTPTQPGTYQIMGYVMSEPNVVAHNWAAALHPTAPVTLTINTPTIFDQLQAQNEAYFNQINAAEHAILPAIPATGPNAGVVPLSLYNDPSILSQYQVPPLPDSLAAAGVSTTAFPANNAIVGETPSLLAQWTQSAQAASGLSSLTSSQVEQAVTTAAQYLIDAVGNGNNGILLLNPDSPTVAAVRQAILQDIHQNPASAVDGLTGPQGALAQRGYAYQEWADVSHVTISANPIVDPYPAGHVVTTLQIQNLVVNLIASGVYQGHEIIGVYPLPPATIDVDLIQDQGQEQWYVSWNTSVSISNPTQVLWTGPAVS